MEIIDHLVAKGVNRRITILLFQDKENYKAFRVITKRLVDFKSRNIIETDNLYSIETFKVLSELSVWFFERPKIKNKLLLNEIKNIKPYNAKSSLV